MVRQPNGPAQFPEPKSVGFREWGTETLLIAAPGKFTLKRIEMKAGAHGGLQFHHRKDEGGVMIEGQMIVRYDDGGKLVERMCRPGDVFYFPQGAVHQSVAVTDVVYIEASTPYLNDRMNVGREYGERDDGLPSTRPEDVVAL